MLQEGDGKMKLTSLTRTQIRQEYIEDSHSTHQHRLGARSDSKKLKKKKE
jgi:hypothetical protein